MTIRKRLRRIGRQLLMVKRYMAALDYDGNGESWPGMEEHQTGGWVAFEDYAALAGAADQPDAAT